MAEPFVSEIRIIGFTFAPRYWAFSNGAIFSTNQNQTLFSLIGNTFGGSVQGQTFALPDMRGRTQINEGSSYGSGYYEFTWGQKGGSETITLTTTQIPSHRHGAIASSSDVDNNLPINNLLGNTYPDYTFGADYTSYAMNYSTIANAGGDKPHSNIQPYLGLGFIICLEGLYPPRS